MKSKSLLTLRLIILSLWFATERTYAGMDLQEDCMINSGPCIREIKNDGIKVILDMYPKPLSAMKDIVFHVTLTDKGGPVTDASVMVDLTMPGMFMGANRPVLTHTGRGEYEGRGVIQACPHGGKTWRAEVRITRQDKTASVSFIFGVE